MARPIRATMVSVVCSLAIAVACSSSPPATPPLPPPPTTHTPPATPTPTAPSTPTLPALAHQETPAGAQAFARYYIEAINLAWHKKDGQAIRSNSSTACIACIGLAHSMDQIATDGGMTQGGDWHVTSVQPAPLQPEVRPIMNIAVTVAPGRWKKTKAGQVLTIKGTKLYVDLRLVWQSGRWLVAGLASE